MNLKKPANVIKRLMAMEAEWMIRISTLRNRPVICENKQTGFVQNLILDANQRNVEAMIVTRGIRGKCVIPSSAIAAITREFILVHYIQKYERGIERQNIRFVRDTNGLIVGRVTDYALDETTLHIEAIEMVRGYLPSERGKVWLFAYAISENSSIELTVPLLQNVESIRNKEENVCDYRP